MDAILSDFNIFKLVANYDPNYIYLGASLLYYVQDKKQIEYLRDKVDLKLKENREIVDSSSEYKMELLLNAGYNMTIKSSDTRSTFLHNIKTTRLIDKLLESGIDINTQDKYGETPLMSIFYNWLKDENIHYDKYHIEEQCPLNSRNIMLKVIQHLIKRGADVNTKNKRGQTIKDIALDYNAYDILNIIENPDNLYEQDHC